MRIRFRAGVVREVVHSGPGWQELRVDVEETPGAPAEPGAPACAWHDSSWLGPVSPGDRVILNTTAVWLGLGTGGRHFVYWVAGRERWEEQAPAPDPGHIVKLRYTPAQVRVHTVEEALGAEAALPPGSPEVDAALAGLPVVVGTLHSQLAPVAGGVAAAFPGARVVHVHTDGGALPARFSRLGRELREAGLLAASISCGHAYGGDLEAVTPYSALVAAARVLRADVVVAVMGPGVVGTGTALGTTALEAAALVDAVAGLGGRPVFALRAGVADRRSRHRGVSHHAVTALRLARSSALVALPAGQAFRRTAAALRAAGLDTRHVLCAVDGRPGLERLRRAGVRVTTMGRGPDEEPAFFLAAAAAGYMAGILARHRAARGGILKGRQDR